MPRFCANRRCVGERFEMKCKDCKYYYPTTDIEGKCKTDIDKYYGFDTTVDGTTERDCASFIAREQMTIEQAIDLLDNLIGMVDDNHGNDYDTALKMAIKALEESVNK